MQMTNHPNRPNALPLVFRQGDVLLRAIKRIPAKARELARDVHGRIVLAHGERTGHAHTFRDKGICSLSTLASDEIEFLLVGGSGATLRHELVGGKKAEHDEIAIPAGSYEAATQVEYTPAELVRVAD
jgi:hypothetical protein